MANKNPVKILTLDTETYDGVKGKLKRIAVYDGKEVMYGYSYKDIENFLIKLSKCYDVHIYIHNLEFDLRKIPELMERGVIDWEKSLVINHKVATIKCKYFTLHDSFKILPMSLKSLSDGFSVECGKLDLWEEVKKLYNYDYDSAEEYQKKTKRNDWEDYCLENGIYTDLVDFLDRCDIDNELFLKYLGYDVISLYQVIEKFRTLLDMDVKTFCKCPSTSSISRYVFKNGYQGSMFVHDANIKTDFEIMCEYNWKNNLEVEEFIRASYVGGRCEVFKMKAGKANHYDYNSIYPSHMDDGALFPVGKPTYYEKPILAKKEWEYWLENHKYLGFLACDVYIPKQNIPPLPVRMGKLVFPCGHATGVWTFEELEFAVKECDVEITNFHAVCIFKKSFPIFENFVDVFADLKVQASKDKNKALRTMCKLLLNTGYGYTGMCRDDKTQLKNYADLDKYDLEDIKWTDKELGYIEVVAEIKSKYVQPQIASYVTSRSRVSLLKALRYADANGEVYYCDTDSVVTTAELPPDWVDNDELHKWKCEKQIESGIFLKPKVYTEIELGENNKQIVDVKFKGVSKDTQRLLTYEFYEHLYDKMKNSTEEEIIVERDKVLLRGIMHIIKEDKDLLSYEVRDKKMKLHVKEKRMIDFDNNVTIPYFFESLDEFEKFDFDKAEPYAELDLTAGGHN